MSETPGIPGPYRGLTPYTEEDARFFFGREADTRIITANLKAARLTLLYGASGVGKSSVLRAGVVHGLREAARESVRATGGPEFLVVYFNAWRDDPLRGLALQIAADAAPALGAQAPAGDLGLRVADLVTRETGAKLLLILDQFEEYFLYHPDEGGEGTFAAEFPRLLQQADLAVNCLISIREDALGQLDRFKATIPFLFDNYLRIRHLDREAGRDAIANPIAEYNWGVPDALEVSIEPALIEAVLDQVKTGEVVLGEGGRGQVDGGGGEARIETPYLQLVMSRLWQEELGAGSRLLRLATLERLGGANKIVRTHLDQVMDRLAPEQQAVAADAFHFLVTPSGSKIAHTPYDLAQYAAVPLDRLRPVLNALSGGEVRILRPLSSPLMGADGVRYEIFHDVLALSILDWRARYVVARERQAAEQRAVEALAAAKREREERRRQTAGWFAIAIVCNYIVWAILSVLGNEFELGDSLIYQLVTAFPVGSALLLPWALGRLWPQLSPRRLALVGLLAAVAGLAAAFYLGNSPVYYFLLSREPLITYALAPTLAAAVTLALLLATPRRDEPRPAPSAQIGGLVVGSLPLAGVLVVGWFALAVGVNLAGGIILHGLAHPLSHLVEDSFRLSEALFAVTQIPLGSALVVPWAAGRLWPRLSTARLVLMGLVVALVGSLTPIFVGDLIGYEWRERTWFTQALVPTVVSALVLLAVLEPGRERQR